MGWVVLGLLSVRNSLELFTPGGNGEEVTLAGGGFGGSGWNTGCKGPTGFWVWGRVCLWIVNSLPGSSPVIYRRISHVFPPSQELAS